MVWQALRYHGFVKNRKGVGRVYTFWAEIRGGIEGGGIDVRCL